MRKPVVDYKDFKLSRINEPKFQHLQYLAGWIVYFLLFFMTEALIPASECYVVHSRLDDLIPFCEYFLIPYFGWYFLIVGSLLYFMFYNTDSFKNMMKFIIVTQITAMVIYILFPNRQDLRPEVFPRDNIFTDGVKLLYSVDTNTNVCPSLHVAYSVGIASVWLKEKTVTWKTKLPIVVFCILVCMSVVFVKQHSVVDIYAAMPVCLLAEIIAFGGYWRNKFRNIN